ncbi:Protein-tyrosine-phosphatase [Variovorax sp. OV329]|nr:Protein-tyrosine-phosphatase [Variovorax sp. OV329]
MRIGGHLFAAESCGQPGQLAKAIHPAALASLENARIPLATAGPRPWTDFTRTSAPRMDFVVTLDEKVLTSEPSWPGQPISALWSFEDVAAVDDPARASHAAMQTLFALQRRLELLINLPLQHSDASALRSDLRDLGRM